MHIPVAPRPLSFAYFYEPDRRISVHFTPGQHHFAVDTGWTVTGLFQPVFGRRLSRGSCMQSANRFASTLPHTMMMLFFTKSVARYGGFLSRLS